MNRQVGFWKIGVVGCIVAVAVCLVVGAGVEQTSKGSGPEVKRSSGARGEVLKLVQLAQAAEDGKAGAVAQHGALCRSLALDFPGAYVAHARLLVAVGKAGAALEWLGAHPSSSRGLRALSSFVAGQCHMQKGDLLRAQTAFDEAVRLCPEDRRFRLARDVLRGLFGGGEGKPGLRLSVPVVARMGPWLDDCVVLHWRDTFLSLYRGVQARRDDVDGFYDYIACLWEKNPSMVPVSQARNVSCFYRLVPAAETVISYYVRRVADLYVRDKLGRLLSACCAFITDVTPGEVYSRLREKRMASLWVATQGPEAPRVAAGEGNGLGWLGELLFVNELGLDGWAGPYITCFGQDPWASPLIVEFSPGKGCLWVAAISQGPNGKFDKGFGDDTVLETRFFGLPEPARFTERLDSQHGKRSEKSKR